MEVYGCQEQKEQEDIGQGLKVKMCPSCPLDLKRAINKVMNMCKNESDLARNTTHGKMIILLLILAGLVRCVNTLLNRARYAVVINQRDIIRTVIQKTIHQKTYSFCVADVTWLRMVD